MADPRHDRERDDETGRPERHGVTDVGRTSGGGSLGHDQPRNAERPADSRDQPLSRDPARPDRKKELDDPVMPDDASALNTKI